MHAQGDSFERALWTALRTLDEKVNLAERMQADARIRGDKRRTERYRRILDESSSAAETLRQFLVRMPVVTPAETEL
jgi:two-component system chemotaxis response regulator CheB